MNKKILTLLKMVILAIGLVLIYDTFIKNMKLDDEIQVKTKYDFAMGTSVSITLYGADNEEELSESIVSRINDLSNRIISWREEESELYKLNNSYVEGEEYELSRELNEILTMSYKICQDSDGALDITVRPLANLWNIEQGTGTDFEVPREADIRMAADNVGYEYLKLTDDGIIIENPDMIIDFGATGKGYALDIIREEYIEGNVKGAIITIGGSVLVYGEKKDGADWKVGIRNPQGTSDEMIGYLTFSGNTNICVSTSGDYEKYIEKDGVIYHHILDRKTGYPADAGLSSVTIVCENGLVSDGLSTACFVLGYEKSLLLLDIYGAEAVFIFKDGSVIVTEGLEDIFSLESE